MNFFCYYFQLFNSASVCSLSLFVLNQLCQQHFNYFSAIFSMFIILYQTASFLYIFSFFPAIFQQVFTENVTYLVQSEVGLTQGIVSSCLFRC